MQPFEYANPRTVQEAVGLLGKSWEEANVLAGGTDLLSLLKQIGAVSDPAGADRFLLKRR